MNSVCVAQSFNSALFGGSLPVISDSWSVRMHSDAPGWKSCEKSPVKLTKGAKTGEKKEEEE